MFSGLVEAVGTVEHAEPGPAGLELGIECPFDDLRPGDSVAVSGVCLTVRECGRGWFSVAAGEPTVRRTTIGGWSPGRHVNLERALRLGDRLGGHIVQGHVDGVAEIVGARAQRDVLLLTAALPEGMAEWFVPLGSVALDGVSLTVNALPEADTIQVAVIEHTRRHTTLGSLQPGSRVHVEGDILGKYVHRLLQPYARRMAREA